MRHLFTANEILTYEALGLCGEAGEYAQAVPSGCDSAVPELGDVAWYLAMIEHATGLRAAWPTFARVSTSFADATSVILIRSAQNSLTSRRIVLGASR